MSKIAISVLHPNAMKAFIYNLNTKQTETVLGGVYPRIGLVNITDSAYLYDSPRLDRRFWAIGAYSVSSSESSYGTVDFSRSVYNRFLR